MKIDIEVGGKSIIFFFITIIVENKIRLSNKQYFQIVQFFIGVAIIG